MDTMPKRDQVNFRVKPDWKADLEAIANFHGLTVSSYIHSLLVRQIRIEKEDNPEAFAKSKLAPVVATIGSGRERQPTRGEVQKMIDGEAINEIERRLKSGKGVSLAPQSKKGIPTQDTTNTKAKRRAR